MPKARLLHTFQDRFGIEDKGRAQSVASAFMDVANGCGLCLLGVSVGGEPPVAESCCSSC